MRRRFGMTGKADAVHVVDFPLVPVGGGEDGGDARQFGVRARQLGLDPDMAGGVEAEEVVVDGEVPVVSPLPAARLVDRGDVLQAPEGILRPALQVAEQLRHQLRGDPVREHVGGGGVFLHPAAELRRQFLRKPEVREFVARRRGAPHLVGAGHPKPRVLYGRAADGAPLHAGAAGVARLGHPVHQDRRRGPLAPPGQVKDRPGRALIVSDLFLEEHEPLQKRLGTGRAAGDIDVHRQDLVHPLHHAVDVVHSPRIGAAPHGDDPARLGHLLVEPQYRGGHLLEDGAGDHHQVRLAGGAAQHLGSEAGNIVAGGERGHHLHETAGETEEHRPERIGAPPVDEVVQAGEKNVVGGFVLCHESTCMN